MRDIRRSLRAAPLTWCGALAFWVACGSPAPTTSAPPAPTTSAPPAPANATPPSPANAAPPAVNAAPPAPASSTPPAPAASDAFVRPAALLEANDLGVGRLTHDFDVTASCPLARVELDLEVESMPDGTVTLRAPSGAEARLPLHVLTTTHFVRTWDWQLLPAMHALRGTDPSGRWSLAVRADGAVYRGGAQPSASPMPTPSFPHAALRVFCEPPTEPASERTIDVRVPAEPAASRPGANVRALVPISRDCTIATMTVSLRERWRSEVGGGLVVVTPRGSTLRVEERAPAPRGATETFSRDVVRAHGLSSAGLWEIVRPRAGGRVTLEEAGVQIDCAP
jgi:hypothetical protein